MRLKLFPQGGLQIAKQITLDGLRSDGLLVFRFHLPET
jgi:hypothetical protein